MQPISGTFCSLVRIAILGAGLALAPAALLAQTLQKAPANPKFRADAPQALADGPAASFGYRPGPVKLSTVRPLRALGDGPLAVPPAAYDLRTDGRVTSVKDQGNHGTCWAHATCASLESCLLPGETRDFSENNMANWHGGDWGFDDGGNAWLATAYLARWAGPYNEIDDAYPRPSAKPAKGATVQKHVQNVLFLPARSGPTDNALIKQAVIDHGALYCAFFWGDAYYNAANQAFYCNATSDANHAVTLVGWDDAFSAANFNTAPAGNGAFLIKNSWGTAWGNAGYFWISYYDTSFQEVVCSYDAQDTGNYMAVNQYDPLGWVRNFGYGEAPYDGIHGANIFTAPIAGQVEAVGVYAVSSNCQVDIRVFTGVTAGQPTSGVLAATQTFTATVPGFYTVPLDIPAPVGYQQRYSVCVEFTTPGYYYPLPVEYAWPGYSSAATANPGEGFYSEAGVAWTDITGFDATCSVCIKGYLGYGDQPEFNVTVGSEFPVTCAVGSFAAAPKVYITGGTLGTKKKSAKVAKTVYPCDTVTCTWKTKVAPGAYILMAQRKVKGEKPGPDWVTGRFNVMPPDIADILSEPDADGNTVLTIAGTYFGTKKPKVQLAYMVPKGDGLVMKRLACKVTAYGMDGVTALLSAKALAKAQAVADEGILFIAVRNTIAEDIVIYGK
jgi:C1A family cysteine protease